MRKPVNIFTDTLPMVIRRDAVDEEKKESEWTLQPEFFFIPFNGLAEIRNPWAGGRDREKIKNHIFHLRALSL
jgi:hypothetical protein